VLSLVLKVGLHTFAVADIGFLWKNTNPFYTMRIVFMGTPDFAVASLAALVEAGYDVVGVVTVPDKPAGRGRKLQASAVKQYAQSKGLPVLQPERLKDLTFLEALQALKPEVQVVVAFRMLPKEVWQLAPTFNLHASLLPKYRGAAPINWAIIHGEKETGVTTFFIDEQIDTGNIIFQDTEPIDDYDTVGTLYERLKHKGAALVLRTVQAIEWGRCPSVPQQGEATQAPKIFRDTCHIDWHRTSAELYNFIRGLSPYPAAWTTWQGKNLKIYWALRPDQEPYEPKWWQHLQPGEWATDQKRFALVRTGDGYLSVKKLQIEGKRPMDIEEFLRGHTL